MAGKKWKWGVLLSGETMSLAETVRFARMAEDAGAENLWTTELGRDAFIPLAAFANVCKTARLGTGVATFARPPMFAEKNAMSLAEMTDERFVLGLGTAPPEWNENWHGVPYRKPAKRMREYVECIRRMWSASPANPIDYEGEFFQVKNYYRLMPAPYASIPIYLAAVQPVMLQLTGAIADGILVNTLSTPKYFTEVVHPCVKKGMAKAGRSEADFEWCAVKYCSVNKDRKQARALARHPIAFHSTLPYFDVVLDPMGFTEPKERIRAARARNDIPAMLAAVTEEMIDALVLAGTPDEVRAQLEPFEELFETLILLSPMYAVDPDESLANHAAMIETFAA